MPLYDHNIIVQYGIGHRLYCYTIIICLSVRVEACRSGAVDCTSKKQKDGGAARAGQTLREHRDESRRSMIDDERGKRVMVSLLQVTHHSNRWTETEKAWVGCLHGDTSRSSTYPFLSFFWIRLLADDDGPSLPSIVVVFVQKSSCRSHDDVHSLHRYHQEQQEPP